jgi:signal transduction histidine kinase
VKKRPLWTIEFEDRGWGFPASHAKKIFQKFFRSPTQAPYAIPGTGLGLYLVKYFIELHNGVISATSQLGEGTSFIIKLKNE